MSTIARRRAQAELAREERPRVLRRRARDRRIAAAPATAATAAASTATAAAAALKAAAADAAELEDVGVLQEEVALLGKEQAEAREVDLPIVDLGRGEIRVDRQRCVQRRRHLVEDIERRLRIRRRLARRVDLALRARTSTARRRGPLPCCNPAKPVAVPATPGFICRLRDTHPSVSPLRWIVRSKLMPQSLLFGLNDSVLNGIAISAVQPSLVARRRAEPDAVPVALEVRRVLIQRFPAHAVRIHLKAVAVTAIEIRDRGSPRIGPRWRALRPGAAPEP